MTESGKQAATISRGRFLGGVCLAAMLTAVAAPASAQDAQPAQDQTSTDPASQDRRVQDSSATQAPPSGKETEPTSPAIDAAAAPVDQIQGPEGEDDVVVTGIRQNLESAQSRKRNADTVVDSITADEIGSFPDKSVAEALQRVAGVTVSRFAGTSDTSHFSAEPSAVIIRGLPQVRSEFNGRDTFSANSARGLSYADISPELLAGVDTYKNQTAELIEGGIAGSINLRTRLPFDAKGRLVSLSADMSYGSIAQRGTPSVSGIYSDRFDTGIGELGFMVNGAYSRVKTATQGVQYDRMAIFDGVFGPGLQYIPSGIFMRENQYDRKRYGISGAAQWKSNDDSIEASAQYNRSQYNNSWREHSVYSSAFSIYGLATDYKVTDAGTVAPRSFTDPFTFDDQGNFLTGSWSAPTGYLGETPTSASDIAANASGQAFFNKCYAWEGCTEANGFAVRRAPQLDAASNALKNKEYTQDIGLNLRWSPTDRLTFRVDGQYVKAEVHNYNASVNSRTYANTAIDLSGKYPTFTIDPTKADNVNLSPGGILNPNNYSYYSASDHTEDSDGKEYALRLDADYDFDTDWLDSLKAGVRYADRDQEVRWGAYNWANIANTWANNADYYNIDRPVYPAGNYEAAGFRGDFFNGDQLNQKSFIFFNMNKLSKLDGLASGLGRPTTGVGDYYPVCSGLGYRAGETVSGDYGCYLPSEILKVSERTWAGYAMVKFGGPNARIGNIGISGNVGVRTVWTRDKSSGSFTFPTAFTPTQLICGGAGGGRAPNSDGGLRHRPGRNCVQRRRNLAQRREGGPFQRATQLQPQARFHEQAGHSLRLFARDLPAGRRVVAQLRDGRAHRAQPHHARQPRHHLRHGRSDAGRL